MFLNQNFTIIIAPGGKKQFIKVQKVQWDPHNSQLLFQAIFSVISLPSYFTPHHPGVLRWGASEGGLGWGSCPTMIMMTIGTWLHKAVPAYNLPRPKTGVYNSTEGFSKNNFAYGFLAATGSSFGIWLSRPSSGRSSPGLRAWWPWRHTRRSLLLRSLLLLSQRTLYLRAAENEMCHVWSDVHMHNRVDISSPKLL